MTISHCHCHSGPFSALIPFLDIAHNLFGLGLRARLVAQCSALPPRATVLCCGFFWKMEDGEVFSTPSSPPTYSGFLPAGSRGPGAEAHTGPVVIIHTGAALGLLGWWQGLWGQSRGPPAPEAGTGVGQSVGHGTSTRTEQSQG